MLKIKILLPLFLIIVLFGILNKTTYSQSKNGDDITIVGEVVDLDCYMQKGSDATGSGHKDCAMDCAKGGSDLGILTNDGKLYIPIGGMGKNANSDLLNYVEDKVEVSGEYYSEGDNLAIKIGSIKKAD